MGRVGTGCAFIFKIHHLMSALPACYEYVLLSDHVIH